MPFTALTGEEEKELYRLQHLYWREALRCEESKAYLAGCVMLGSALETLLILMVNCYSDEADQTGKGSHDKGQTKAAPGLEIHRTAPSGQSSKLAAFAVGLERGME